MKKYLILLACVFTLNANAQTTQDAKNYVDSNIVTNGNQEITGAKLNTALNKMIAAIDTSYFVTLEDFGAIGDGITNDANSLQLAINSKKPILLLTKKYLINTQVNIIDSTYIIGQGVGSVLKTTANIQVLNLIGKNIELENFSIKGNKLGANQTAISAIGNNTYTSNIGECIISNLVIDSFFKAGIYVTNILGIGDPNFNHNGGVIIDNCIIKNNGVGVFLDVRAEYNTISSSSFLKNTSGVKINGGNNAVVNCNISNNTYGIEVGTGDNDGHGIVSSCRINHNTSNNIRCVGVVKNYLFSNCMIYAGTILVSASSGVKISNCEISITQINVNNSSYFSLINNFFEINPTVTFTNNTNMNIRDNFSRVSLNSQLIELPATTGQATLSAGSVTVSNANIQNTSIIVCTANGTTNSGFVSVTKTPGVGFTIQSSNVLDGRIVDYMIKY